jgi:hypothetical protein
VAERLTLRGRMIRTDELREGTRQFPRAGNDRFTANYPKG